jgi:hypothetical protein
MTKKTMGILAAIVAAIIASIFGLRGNLTVSEDSTVEAITEHPMPINVFGPGNSETGF